jgi:hypothetical protein
MQFTRHILDVDSIDTFIHYDITLYNVSSFLKIMVLNRLLYIMRSSTFT